MGRSRGRKGNIPISESVIPEKPHTHHTALENVTAFESEDGFPAELYSMISTTASLLKAAPQATKT